MVDTERSFWLKSVCQWRKKPSCKSKKKTENIISHSRCFSRPVAVGGFAGGTKYIVSGILFKFARDNLIAPNIWMYGGDRSSDER